MRALTCAVALAVIACPALRAGGIEIRRVWPQYYEADTFQSLNEELTGREISGRWTVLRTQPEARGGLYFLTRVRNPGPAVADATFAIQVIAPNSTEIHTFVFRADLPHGERLFEFGVTGKDWPGRRREQPVAWQMEIQAPAGTRIAAASSYLWEKPPG